MSKTTISAALIVIGDEILSGRTQDANLSYLAKWLNNCGVVLVEARVVLDDEATIISTVNELRAKHTYVFTTGGIGPTHDDITSLSIAKAFDVPLVEDAEARELMLSHNPNDVTPERMKMAQVPQGARLIKNSLSKAPGFQIENVFVMAGIPAIMQVMLDDLDGYIEGAGKVLSKTINAFVGESLLAADLGIVQNNFPDTAIGSYPFYRDGVHGAALVVRAVDEKMIDAALSEIKVRLAKRNYRIEDAE